MSGEHPFDQEKDNFTVQTAPGEFDIDPQPTRLIDRFNDKRRAVIGVVGVGLASLAIANCSIGSDSDSESQRDPDPTAEEIADMNEMCEEIAETWAMPGLDHGDNNRWKADGSQEIRDAVTNEDARRAAYSALGEYKLDENVMAGAARGLLNREVDPATLKDENGCATVEAEILFGEMQLAMSLARDITPDYAPDDWYNSGVDENGNVVWSHTPGVGGDQESRKCIKIELANGKVIYIMGRCIQIVTEEPEGPEGPTDSTTTTTTTTAKPTTSTTSTSQPPSVTTSTKVPPKNDDGILPGSGEPSEQTPGTPDNPGDGPAEQTPDPNTAYLPNETTPPTQPRRTSTTLEGGEPSVPSLPPTATTSPSPSTTNPPVPGTAPPTSNPPGSLPPAP